jgi:glucose dehydrogenase
MNTEKLKWILLGVFLILIGLSLLGVSLGGSILNIVAGLCAVVAGILFLINR